MKTFKATQLFYTVLLAGFFGMMAVGYGQGASSATPGELKEHLAHLLTSPELARHCVKCWYEEAATAEEQQRQGQEDQLKKAFKQDLEAFIEKRAAFIAQQDVSQARAADAALKGMGLETILKKWQRARGNSLPLEPLKEELQTLSTKLCKGLDLEPFVEAISAQGFPYKPSWMSYSKYWTHQAAQAALSVAQQSASIFGKRLVQRLPTYSADIWESVEEEEIKNWSGTKSLFEQNLENVKAFIQAAYKKREEDRKSLQEKETLINVPSTSGPTTATDAHASAPSTSLPQRPREASPLMPEVQKYLDSPYIAELVQTLCHAEGWKEISFDKKVNIFHELMEVAPALENKFGRPLWSVAPALHREEKLVPAEGETVIKKRRDKGKESRDQEETRKVEDVPSQETHLEEGHLQTPESFQRIITALQKYLQDQEQESRNQPLIRASEAPQGMTSAATKISPKILKIIMPLHPDKMDYPTGYNFWSFLARIEEGFQEKGKKLAASLAEQMVEDFAGPLTVSTNVKSSSAESQTDTSSKDSSLSAYDRVVGGVLVNSFIDVVDYWLKGGASFQKGSLKYVHNLYVNRGISQLAHEGTVLTFARLLSQGSRLSSNESVRWAQERLQVPVHRVMRHYGQNLTWEGTLQKAQVYALMGGLFGVMTRLIDSTWLQDLTRQEECFFDKVVTGTENPPLPEVDVKEGQQALYFDLLIEAGA